MSERPRSGLALVMVVYDVRSRDARALRFYVRCRSENEGKGEVERNILYNSFRVVLSRIGALETDPPFLQLTCYFPASPVVADSRDPYCTMSFLLHACKSIGP